MDATPHQCIYASHAITTVTRLLGPAVMRWTQDEQLDGYLRFANARVLRSMVSTAAALGTNATLAAGSRERAWEHAHQNTAIVRPTCNGRTAAQLAAAYGLTQAVIYGGSGNAATVVSAWLASAALCPALMNSASTSAGVAVAHDLTGVFVVYFK